MERKACRPIGPLAHLLEAYQAPQETQVRVAKRAGELIGRSGFSLPIAAIEHVIVDSMVDNRGVPDWQRVERGVGMIATEVRHRIARRS